MADYYPKISIVTASYNQAEFIEKAILSVTGQNYANYEHIIYDNCSSDGTIDILKKYPHLIWISERDTGQSDALNKGFKKATGDIIGWLNADDLYLPGCFQTVAGGLKDNPELSVIYGDYRWINEKGDLMKLRREIDFDPFIYKYLHFTYIPSAAAFFKRKIFDDGYFLNTAYELSMDYEFFLRIAQKGCSFTHIRAFLADFRWHSQSKSSLFTRKQLMEREEVLYLYDRFLQGIYRPVRPAVRSCFLIAARIKRFILKNFL